MKPREVTVVIKIISDHKVKEIKEAAKALSAYGEIKQITADVPQRLSRSLEAWLSEGLDP